MKKWGPVGMLFVGVIIALWVALSSMLASESRVERDRAERALREQLGIPEPKRGETQPPPSSVRPPSDAPEASLPEDLRERWQRVFEQVEGLFALDCDTEAERFRVALCASYERPVEWPETRLIALEGFVAQHDGVIREIVSLTKLGIPSHTDMVDEAMEHAATDPEGVLRAWRRIPNCFALVTVASAIEARNGSFLEAQSELAAALRLAGRDSVSGWCRGIDLTALDVPAEEVFRGGELSPSTLSELVPELRRLVEKQVFVDGVKEEARYLLWESRQPIGMKHHDVSRQAMALAQKTLLRPLYERTERRAFDHAGELAELAPLPYCEIRDDLARIEEEAQPRWYDSTVKNITELNLARDFVCQARWEARRDMVHLAIVLEEHFAQRGALPESLDAVAPAFDDGLPVDVFTGDAYHYGLVEGGYILHSSGKNGIDDGGDGDDVVLRIRRDGA